MFQTLANIDNQTEVNQPGLQANIDDQTGAGAGVNRPGLVFKIAGVCRTAVGCERVGAKMAGV